MIQVHMHSLGTERQETHWSNAEVNDRQKNIFGANALSVLFANYWAPVQPSWSDGACFEIRFVS